jgi:hypothetical protein
LDGALGDAILEVGVDATEGELLVRVIAGMFECVVGKLTIVAVVMQDSDAMLSLAAMVLMDVSSTWGCKYLRRLKWSTKMVAQR